jgi:flagellar protein FliS
MFVPTLDRAKTAATTTSPVQEQYLAGAVSTASPAKLVVMLYDRLVLDLGRAEASLKDESLPLSGRKSAARKQILHAQEIVMELRSSLDPAAGWEGTKGLSDLYGYVFTELVQANISMDVARIAGVRAVIEPLRDAWREAALQLATAAAV